MRLTWRRTGAGIGQVTRGVTAVAGAGRGLGQSRHRLIQLDRVPRNVVEHPVHPRAAGCIGILADQGEASSICRHAAPLQGRRDVVTLAGESHRDLVSDLARLSALTVEKVGQRPKSSATAVVNNASVFVDLEGIIDFAKESQRLEKEINKLTIELTKVGKKLANEGFLNKAPADVIEKVREKQSALLEKQQKLQMNVDRIKAADA